MNTQSLPFMIMWKGEYFHSITNLFSRLLLFTSSTLYSWEKVPKKCDVLSVSLLPFARILEGIFGSPPLIQFSQALHIKRQEPGNKGTKWPVSFTTISPWTCDFFYKDDKCCHFLMGKHNADYHFTICKIQISLQH